MVSKNYRKQASQIAQLDRMLVCDLSGFSQVMVTQYGYCYG